MIGRMNCLSLTRSKVDFLKKLKSYVSRDREWNHLFKVSATRLALGRYDSVGFYSGATKFFGVALKP